MIKMCSKCGEEKDIRLFHKDSHKTSGVRSYCKECSTNMRSKWREQKVATNDVEYRIRVMAEKLLQRVNYSKLPKYEKRLHSYKENNVECLLGSTVEEVMNTLRANFGAEIGSMLNNGELPTVDRKDSTGDYVIGNIRIISHYENSVEGFRSANRQRMKAVEVNGVSYESINQASRELNIDKRVLRLALKTGKPSKKYNISVKELNI